MSLKIQNKSSDVALDWPFLPNDIPGIDYELIDQVSKSNDIVNNIVKYVKKSLDQIKQSEQNKQSEQTEQLSEQSEQTELTPTELTTESNDVLDEYFSRIEPPFNFLCVFSHEGCVKKASFKNEKNNGYYCWFHINCSK